MSHAILLASHRSGRAAALRAMASRAANGMSRSCHPACVSAGIGNPNRPFKRAFGAI